MTDRGGVRDAVIDGLAQVNGVSAAQVENQITAAGGDNLLELDSRTAEWIIACVEKQFGATLPPPVELGPKQIATVAALSAAIAAALGITD